MTITLGAWHLRRGCRHAGRGGQQLTTTFGDAPLAVATRSGQPPCAYCTLTELPAIAIRRGLAQGLDSAPWTGITCGSYWRPRHEGCSGCQARAELADEYSLPVHRDERGHVLLAAPAPADTPAPVLTLLGRLHHVPAAAAPVTSPLLQVAWLTRTERRMEPPVLHFDVSRAVLAPTA